MATNLLPRDGCAYLYEDAVPANDSDILLDRLLAEIDWRQEKVRVLGKAVAVPRLTAWVGDKGYRYSGIDHEARPWPALLTALKQVAETCARRSFNGVLLNLYRDGRDGVSWHADDETSLGRQPVIASISLGGVRRFVLKHRHDGTRVVLALSHGSCLVMARTTQTHWVHSIPKTRHPVAPRINLTFRAILAPIR